MLSKRSVFSTAIKLPSLLQRLMSIVFAAGQHGPGDASQFVGDGDHDFVARSTLGQPVHPLPESSSVVLDAKQYRAGTVDQHATQINVAALADAEQFLLAPSGVLSRHHAHPGREVAPAAKGRAVADGGHGGGGDQRAKAGDLAKTPAARIFLTDAFDLVGDRLDVDLQSASTPATCDPAASAGAGSGSARHLRSPRAGSCAGGWAWPRR